MEHFTCCRCLIRLRSYRSLLTHMESIHEMEPSFSVVCGIDSCQREYKTVRCLKRHIRKFHVTFHDTELGTRVNSGQQETDVMDIDSGSIVTEGSEDTVQTGKECIDVKKHIAGKLLWLREECKLSYKACGAVSSACSDIFSAHNTNISAKLASATEISQGSSSHLTDVIFEEGAYLQQAFDSFSDHRNLNQYIRQHFLFVEPVEYFIGVDHRRVRSGTCLLYTSPSPRDS